MFKAAFEKCVFDSDSDDKNARFAVLSRQEVLPFAPLPGQAIQWPLEIVQKIISSAWSTEYECFKCRVEDEYTVNARLDAPDFDEYLTMALDRGWTVAAIYPATK